MKLQSHAWLKDLFTFPDRPMDSNLTAYKGFIDMVSDATLQLTFKKPLLVEFGGIIKNNIHDDI